MPGSSLWLLPPASHPLQPLLTSLIQKTSTHFNSPHVFLPHVTLTSDIDPAAYGSEPQKWLDGLPFPDGKDVKVTLGRLASEDVYVRKLYFCVKKEGVGELAWVTRRVVKGFEGEEEARRWVVEGFGPHCSLLYHDCPKVDEKGIADAEKMVADIGVRLDGEGDLGGWVGGRVVLVDTSKPIGEWTPIATRIL